MGVSGVSGLSGPENFYTKYFSISKILPLKNFSREKFRAKIFFKPKKSGSEIFQALKFSGKSFKRKKKSGKKGHVSQDGSYLTLIVCQALFYTM
jgi:hypothetical protein